MTSRLINQQLEELVFVIEKSYAFEAGHVLKHHDGKCCQPHGHSYVIKIVIKKEELIAEGPKTNMVMDFSTISHFVKPMIEKYLDHKWLNDTLNTDSPTAEYIAMWIYNFLESNIKNIYAVTVFETATSSATYQKN